MAMTPLAEAKDTELAPLRGLFFDLDDTLLTHGVLTRAAYGALWDMHDAGLRLVAVTGRPSGWGEVIVRQWPVDGVVAENGAIALLRHEERLRREQRRHPLRRLRRDASGSGGGCSSEIWWRARGRWCPRRG